MNIKKINDLSEKEIEIYTKLSEVQLLRFNEPNPGIFIAESLKILERALNADYTPLSLLIDERIINTPAMNIVSKCGDIPVYSASSGVLDELTGFHLTGGVLCAMMRKPAPNPSDIIKDAKRIVILENVTNPTNVGAIFRSAAALGMDAVLVTRSCSDPLYRRSARVSMGTVFQIPWTYIDNKKTPWPTEGMRILSENGFKTSAMALKNNSISIRDPKLKNEDKLAILMGSEGYGLMDETLDICDYIIKIPMYHNVDSLNVAAASALAFWELGNSGC